MDPRTSLTPAGCPVPSQDSCKSLRFPSSDAHLLESRFPLSSPTHCLPHLLSFLSLGCSFHDFHTTPMLPHTRHLSASVLPSEGFPGSKGTRRTSQTGAADIPWPSSHFSKAGLSGGSSWVMKQLKAPMISQIGSRKFPEQSRTQGFSFGGPRSKHWGRKFIPAPEPTSLCKKNASVIIKCFNELGEALDQLCPRRTLEMALPLDMSCLALSSLQTGACQADRRG